MSNCGIEYLYMNFNYQKICQDLLKNMEERTVDILQARFGLKNNEKKTLDAIGKNYGICRERIRQVEEYGISKIKSDLEKYQDVFQSFREKINMNGGLKREDKLLLLLGGSDFQNHISFLLALGEDFKRFPADKDFYSFWAVDKNSFNTAKKVIDYFCDKFSKAGQPSKISDEDSAKFNLDIQSLSSYLEISKKIGFNYDGFFGLKNWPEITPKGIKDKIYLILKKENKPLHFKKISEQINSIAEGSKKPVLIQTVHNELIRNQKFILIGRGIYALSDWGYYPGKVKDVIAKVLESAQKPLTREEILNKVLEQRLVKENTVFLNLSDRRYFLRDFQGKYKTKNQVS